MKMFTKILVLFLVLSLSACITSGSKKIQAIKESNKVLVVSSMGDEYELLYIGFTVFSNKFNTLDVKDWNLDSIIESKVADMVVIDKLDLATENLTSIKRNMTKLSKNFWTDGVVFNGFDDKIFPFAKDNNYDLILFVNSYLSEDPVFFTGLKLDGYGLYKRKVFGNPSTKYFAMVSTSLYNVETKKKIAGSSMTKSTFTNKHNTKKAVDSIDNEAISKDKDIIISLIMNSIKSQFAALGIIKTSKD